jgi:cysteinyl-tRNA synthetase
MALDLLGDGFDLHGAGDDLVFPHNENEIAQAGAAGHEFARHWIHSGMVQINAEKMSKSSGNFRSLADALDAYDPRAFRVAVLLTQYRSAMELGDSELTAAASAVDRFDSLVRRAMAVEIDLSTASIDRKREQSFRAAMDDDFATPAALAIIFAAVSEANQAFDCEDIETAATLVATVKELAGVLGIVIGRIEDSSGDSRIDQLVVDRETARANRDFATADRIRDDLEAEGVVIADRASGTTWHRR